MKKKIIMLFGVAVMAVGGLLTYSTYNNVDACTCTLTPDQGTNGRCYVVSCGYDCMTDPGTPNCIKDPDNSGKKTL